MMWSIFRKTCSLPAFFLLMSVLLPIVALGQLSARPSNTEINAPADLAYDDAGHLFAVEQLGKRLTQIDLRRSLLRHVSMGRVDSFPHAVATDHKGGLYIADFNGGLQHLDLATGARQILIKTTAGSLDS